MSPALADGFFTSSATLLIKVTLSGLVHAYVLYSPKILDPCLASILKQISFTDPHDWSQSSKYCREGVG